MEDKTTKLETLKKEFEQFKKRTESDRDDAWEMISALCDRVKKLEKEDTGYEAYISKDYKK